MAETGALPRETTPGGADGSGPPRRSGILASLNRWLGWRHLATATALLVSAAVVAAVSLHVLLSVLGLYPVGPDVLFGAALITILIATPVVLYAQLIIRELVRSRQALRRMTDELAWALHKAEEGNRAKSTFLAAMSHELRTPLNAIIGFSDVMAGQRLGPLEDPRYRGYAADINASGTHLLEIINDILDIAKIESGQAVIEDDDTMPIAEVVEASMTIVEPMAVQAGVSLQALLPAVAVRLTGVERMIRQILINILSNAVKFTAAGGSVVLDVVPRYNGWLLVTVTDTGIGMSEDETRIALTPFGQIDGPLNRRHGGTGLGLPLARSMMELHGGHLTIVSAPGQGTTVELRFPPNRVSFERVSFDRANGPAEEAGAAVEPRRA